MFALLRDQMTPQEGEDKLRPYLMPARNRKDTRANTRFAPTGNRVAASAPIRTFGPQMIPTLRLSNADDRARIEALLRRAQMSHDTSGAKQLRFGRFVIDSGSVQAIAGDRQVQLTPTEFKLLRTLASEPGRVFTRDDLLTGVWGYEPGSDTRLVDVHVGRLRKKLEDATVTEVAIETARGFGYRLVDTTRGR